MNKTILLAGFVIALGAPAAQACPQGCGARPVVYQQPVVEYVAPVLPPHYIVEQGPIHDGLGVVANPRVFKPRHATFVALASYPYVKQARSHHRAPLRVYY